MQFNKSHDQEVAAIIFCNVINLRAYRGNSNAAAAGTRYDVNLRFDVKRNVIYK